MASASVGERTMVSPTWRGEEVPHRDGGVRSLRAAPSVVLLPLPAAVRLAEYQQHRGRISNSARFIPTRCAGAHRAGCSARPAPVQAALAALAAPVFKGFTAEEIEGCTARSNIISCADGDRVLRKGGVARNVFVVLSGARAFDVDVLSDDTRILSLSERSLRQLTATDPAVAAKLLGNISKILCRRLANA